MDLFRRNENGRFYVFKIPADGGSAVQAITSAAAVAREAPQGANLYFVRSDGGIWRRSVAGGAETLVIPDFKLSMLGYWTVVSDGIYYVAEERHPDSDRFGTASGFLTLPGVEPPPSEHSPASSTIGWGA